MKYVLSKQCSFSRNSDSLIGYTNLSFCNGVWVPQYHMDVDGSVYQEKMQSFCKYIKDVIVPNGYESIEYLVNRLNLKTIGLSRYQRNEDVDTDSPMVTLSTCDLDYGLHSNRRLLLSGFLEEYDETIIVH